MAKSLLHSFASLDQTTKDLLADIDSPRLLAFAALHLARRRFGTNILSAEHIIACLESAGVAATRKSIGRSIASAKGFITRSISDDGEVFYKLMTRGEREAEKFLSGRERLAVLRIEAGQPRQARIKLGEMLFKLKGVVKICDPFYGISTLDSLDLLPKSSEVRFLTQKTTEPSRRIEGAIRDFCKERSKTELRKASTSSKLHDRYILADQQIIILGHGIKDIGNKESFVIVLNEDLVPDLINETNTSFDREWGMATKI
jgi:hypothetical protein